MFNGPACYELYYSITVESSKYFSDTFSVNAGKPTCVSVHTVNTTSYIRATVERYHVSELLHHTLHHLRPVLQQLRGEFLIEPGLRHKQTHTHTYSCQDAVDRTRRVSVVYRTACHSKHQLTSSSLAISSAGVITSSWLSSWLGSLPSSNKPSDIVFLLVVKRQNSKLSRN